MLKILKEENFYEYIDFAYDLALNLEKSVYPTYTDGIKTKEDFIDRALNAYKTENEEILLFEMNGKVEGWIHYYALPEDEYVSLCAFNINNHIEKAIDEFISYISSKYSGCTLYFGLPTENTTIIYYLEQLNFEKQEECNVDVLLFNNYVPLKEEMETVRITRDNYSDFEILHKVHDEDMYWNNKRIKEEVEKWDIFLIKENDQPLGTIYYYCLDSFMEIFGVDYLNNQYDEAIFKALLTKSLNEGKQSGMESLTYFNDDIEHKIISQLGFNHVSKYVLYTKVI